MSADLVTHPSNIHSLHASITPDPDLVEGLEALLKLARSGKLQWFWGVGLTWDNMCPKLKGGAAPSPYDAAGRLAFLADEYRESITRTQGSPTDE